MKHINILGGVIIFLFFSCSKSQTNCKLNGTVLNNDSKWVFIMHESNIDSVEIKNNKFEYEKLISEPQFIRIYTKDKSKSHLLLIDSAENISITFDCTKYNVGYSAKGSKGSELLQKLNSQYTKMMDSIAVLNTRYNQILENRSLPSDTLSKRLETIKNEYNKLVNIETKFITDFVLENSESFASLTALFQSFDIRTGKPLLLNDINNITYFELVDSILMKKYPNSNTVMTFHENVAQIKMDSKKIEEQTKNKLKIGDKAPEIALPSITGNTLRLSSLKGKYVLLDFWASWCNPCRVENSKLLSVYNTLKYKNFEIFQVSLDYSQNAWKEAIVKDKLPSKYQVCDFKKWKSEAAIAYDIHAIPANFLIDCNGNIIAINISTSKLEELLYKTLK